ncbi:hypothetical protein K443DRAFT_680927 [Laccaria amethystina LaAM-08-1]|uniref:Uncharacterized protein n=1 Tax=Laccaria amethystina LaAM-08-1 TaxID=1095629 RepID=A0A0C9XKU5_9AGAR|nr:hypothetical protein K443DRAFT_680927 [Laccaria amethystina LaAM-08-1]
MPPLPLIRLVVSSDGEQYRVVDVTGARDGSDVRGQIFYKLDIPIESQRSYFIYPSEIGSFALGSPLSDRNLFSLCQEHGNPSGFLKFFVSHSPNGPARQQESASVKLCIPILRISSQ